MKLQTQIPLEQQGNNLIGYNSKVILLGSCFAESIGEKLEYFKFQNNINPFGILFHPIAIENLINSSLLKKKFSEEDIFFQNGLWHCHDVHSKLSHRQKEHLLNNLNKIILNTNEQLKDASHIILTLGTAWIYRLIENQKIVANCHKVPQKQFYKELLSAEEIRVSLQRVTEKIRKVNSNASIIFTVSPIRHLKDGFVENTRSKAHLISAVHQIVNEFNNSFYFPSYEIMMDELRDYRFYKEDMIHPSSTAVNYIWEKFKSVWISLNAEKTMNDVDTIRKGFLHRPFNPNTEAHLQFLRQLKQKQKTIQAQFPHIVLKNT